MDSDYIWMNIFGDLYTGHYDADQCVHGSTTEECLACMDDRKDQTIAALRKENSELKETLAAYDYHYGGLHPAAVEGIKKQMARKVMEE
jgi:IS30 family transposase